MFEIICISKVISAGYMTDINSHVELPAPSHRPGAPKPAQGDTLVAVGEFKVNGITGLWFCMRRRSWVRAQRGRSSFQKALGKDGIPRCLWNKNAGRKKTPFYLKNYVCAFPSIQHQRRACRNTELLLFLSPFSFQNQHFNQASCLTGKLGSAHVR